MASKYILFICLGVIGLTSYQCKEYENPLDPASKNFVLVQPDIPSQVKVIDFEGDPTRSIWGYTHRADGSETNGGTIDTSFSNIVSPENESNRVLKLDYNVSGARNLAIWSVTLGAAISNDSMHIGGFNPRAMGLDFLTFLIKGEKGDEKFRFTLTDVDRQSAEIEETVSATEQWAQYKIRLPYSLQDKIKFNALTSLNAVFVNGRGAESGVVFLDNFAFEWE